MVANPVKTLLAVGVVAFCAAHADAQVRCTGTETDRIRLSAAAVAACVSGQRWMEHVTLQGPDVIDAIRSGRHSGMVRIRSSVIEHGLSFSNLPNIRVSDIPDAELRKTIEQEGSYGRNETVRLV